MCVLCGEALTAPHWTDAHAAGGATRALDARMRALAPVLAHAGLSARAWGPRVVVLADRRGRQEVLRDLGELWPAAERLLGRPLDPLDPALILALEARAAA